MRMLETVPSRACPNENSETNLWSTISHNKCMQNRSRRLESMSLIQYSRESLKWTWNMRWLLLVDVPSVATIAHPSQIRRDNPTEWVLLQLFISSCKLVKLPLTGESKQERWRYRSLWCSQWRKKWPQYSPSCERCHRKASGGKRVQCFFFLFDREHEKREEKRKTKGREKREDGEGGRDVLTTSYDEMELGEMIGK